VSDVDYVVCGAYNGCSARGARPSSRSTRARWSSFVRWPRVVRRGRPVDIHLRRAPAARHRRPAARRLAGLVQLGGHCRRAGAACRPRHGGGARP
jgi:hypothetical protein